MIFIELRTLSERGKACPEGYYSQLSISAPGMLTRLTHNAVTKQPAYYGYKGRSDNMVEIPAICQMQPGTVAGVAVRLI